MSLFHLWQQHLRGVPALISTHELFHFIFSSTLLRWGSKKAADPPQGLRGHLGHLVPITVIKPVWGIALWYPAWYCDQVSSKDAQLPKKQLVFTSVCPGRGKIKEYYIPIFSQAQCSEYLRAGSELTKPGIKCPCAPVKPLCLDGACAAAVITWPWLVLPFQKGSEEKGWRMGHRDPKYFGKGHVELHVVNLPGQKLKLDFIAT